MRIAWWRWGVGIGEFPSGDRGVLCLSAFGPLQSNCYCTNRVLVLIGVCLGVEGGLAYPDEAAALLSLEPLRLQPLVPHLVKTLLFRRKTAVEGAVSVGKDPNEAEQRIRFRRLSPARGALALTAWPVEEKVRLYVDSFASNVFSCTGVEQCHVHCF